MPERGYMNMYTISIFVIWHLGMALRKWVIWKIWQWIFSVLELFCSYWSRDTNEAYRYHDKYQHMGRGPQWHWSLCGFEFYVKIRWGYSTCTNSRKVMKCSAWRSLKVSQMLDITGRGSLMLFHPRCGFANNFERSEKMWRPYYWMRFSCQ